MTLPPPGLHEIDDDVTADTGGGSLNDVTHCKKCRWDPLYHHSFIYASDFDVAHIEKYWPNRAKILSEGQKAEAVAIIRALAHYVVRVNVPYVSPFRPKTTENGNPYMFGDKAGECVNAVGSAWVSQGYCLIRWDSSFINHCF